MDKLPKAMLAAAGRLDAKKPISDLVHDQVNAKQVRFLDRDNLPKRIDRLLKNPLVESALAASGVADELRSAPSVEALSAEAHVELERVLGGAPDFMPIWFLTRGAELRRTVVRVRARTAAGKERMGTGFLVGPGIVLTNSHVLDWSDIDEEPLEDIAPHSLIEFDYEEQFSGTMLPAPLFRLDPDTLLLHSPWDLLDYALVAVNSRSIDGLHAIEDFGYNRLSGDTGKINKGEPVFIVQHPNGQPKQVVLQNNRLIDRDELIPYLTYEADTEIGSSGSPVFNRQWEVVALHHAPQIARDEQQRIKAKGGGLWTPDMGTGRVLYLDLNEGIRVSRLMQDWERKLGDVQGGQLLNVPERCSAEGQRLLAATLATQHNAPPPALATPVPIEHRRAGNVRPSGGFPRPD